MMFSSDNNSIELLRNNMLSPLHVRDILLQVTSLVDDETLEKISHTDLWNVMRTFASDEYFWKLRTENLIRKDLPKTTESWKNIYHVLDEALNSLVDPFSVVDTSSVTAIKILFILGYVLSENDLLLSRAVSNGHSETVKLLLEEGSDPSGIFYLDSAVHNNRVEVVRILLQDSRVSPEGDDNNVIITASGLGYLEIVKLLLEDDRTISSRPEALRRASQEGHLEVVKLLLFRIRYMKNSGNIILGQAIRHLEVVKLLLEHPSIHPTEYTLGIAIEEEQLEVVKLFLAYPDISITEEVLHKLMYCNSLDILKLVLQKLDILPEKILSRAAKKNNAQLVSLILEHSSISQENYREALVLSIKRGSGKIIPLLVADPRFKSVDMDKLLIKACRSGDVDSAAIILFYQLSYSSNELLRIAIDSRKIEVIDLLLRDKRIDLDISQINFSKMIELIFPLIREKALEYFMNRDIYQSMPRGYYKSLVLFLILRRPTFQEALEWILLHPNREMRDAARSLTSGVINHESPLMIAYLGFLLLAIPDMDLKKIKKLLQAEGVNQQGIRLASGLIGAFLGETGGRKDYFNYKQIYQVLSE